ncbi:MAG: M67 family peptidase [Candidatus Electrothrix sp. AR4]|nr:M67 family peptidase [Candidatus Electrothrix sp. AR4]
MELKITRQIYTELLTHSRQAAPLEACGYLAQRDGLVEQFYPLTNLDKSPEHFSMDPTEQFRVIKTIRNRRQKLRAVYHSHPETPARPSPEDIRLAADQHISYLIVSLLDQERPVRSFRIRQGVVTEELLLLID